MRPPVGSLALRFLTAVSAVLLLAYAGFLALEKPFPAPSEPRSVTYSWDFANRPYRLTLALHKNIYDFYGGQPKGVLIGKEESSLVKYLTVPEPDNSIKELVAGIDDLAAQTGLNEEQKLELAVAFVQNIPYDHDKANSDDGPRRPRYAYEVLFDNQGICSETSFLMYAVLREMGYGAAVFSFPKENHMTVGVESPREYSTDNSGYSLIETTSPKIKIGIIPNLDASTGQALQTEALQEYNLRNPNTTEGKQLSSPTVYAKTNGYAYNGIIKTFEIQKEVAEIKNYLTEQKPVIETKQAGITELDRRLDDLRAQQDIAAFNSLVYLRNAQAGELKILADDYNGKVSRYNDLISAL